MTAKGQARFIAAGIAVNHDDAIVGGEVLKLNKEDVGVVNSPCWSHRFNKSLALVHRHPNAAIPGTQLDVVSGNFNGTALVEAIPFFDPTKSPTHV